MELVTAIGKDHIVKTEDRSGNGMKRVRYTFKNGLGISIIQGEYSYGGPQGLYEVAPLNKKGRIDGTILYWGEDVKGYLTLGEVADYAGRIASKEVEIEG